MSMHVKEDGREYWTSRAAFYFAATGSAVGFGNVWRFPSLVFEYGGGAFFIPYVLALFLIGIPILVLEVGLGQYYQTGDVNVFGSIHRRLRGVGLSSIACGFILVTYYSMLLAWVCNAFFDSFGDNMWASEDVDGDTAVGYFVTDIIGSGTVGEDGKPTRLVGKNVGYSFLTWTIVYLCVAFGLKWTGRITYFTMGFPIVLLFVFLGRAVSLEGAQDGIDEYIRESNWSVFTDNPSVWSRAVAQIFFSIGITFGIMTAYGSHCPRNEPAFMNSCVVAISNSLFSFIAGFAVFATLGYQMNLINEKAAVDDTVEPIESVSQLNYASFGLVFGSWPVALGTLPGGEHWIRLFFVMLFLLGIDSAFSFIEGFLTVLQDSKLFHDKKRYVLTLGLSVSAFLFSLIYATDAGLSFLDVIDYYVNFVMLLVGGFECFSAGWIYNIEEQFEDVGKPVVLSYIATTFGSTVAASAVWFGMKNTDTAVWAGFVTFACFYVFGMGWVHFLLNKKKQESPEHTLKDLYYKLLMKNVLTLSRDLSEVCGYMPHYAWGFLIKHFIPPIIIVLFALGADANTVIDGKSYKTFGHYSGYPTQPYQVLGIMTVVFAGFLFFSSLIYPRMYDSLQKYVPPEAEKKVSSEEDAAEAQPEKKDEAEEVGVEEAKPDQGAVEAQPENEETAEPVEIAA